MFRTLLFGFTLCFLSSNLFAQCDIMGFDYPCDSDCGVSLCNPCSSLSLEGRLLYFKPGSSNLHYLAEADPLPAPTPNWKIRDIKPSYKMGFEIGVRANFFCRKTQAHLNWVHFNSKSNDSRQVPSEDRVGPFFEIGSDASGYTHGKGHVAFKYDAVNLNYGFCLNFGECIKANCFAGISAARIKQDLTSFYSNNDETISRQIHSPSTFWGAGPQLGLNLSFTICNGYQFIGAGSAALLMGEHSHHTTFKSITPILAPLEIPSPNTQSTHVRNRSQLVPAFEGKVGFAYTWELCYLAMDFEIGYQALVYLNAIQSTDISSEVVTPPVIPDTVGVYARTFHRTISNFSLSGPYIKVNVGF